MRLITKRTLGLLAAGALLLSACGSGEVLGPPDESPDDPLIQIHSEGGFVPVEWSLGRGPTYTVTYGGTFIFPGVTTLEYPGKLVPRYFEGQLNDDQMSRIRGILDEMGIAEIEDEHDDSVDNVADASTEVIRYWDQEGVHRYSVYALGITDQPSADTTARFAELFEYLHELSGSVEGTDFEAERVQVVAGADYEESEPDFVDIRSWPLEGENPDLWEEFTTVGGTQVWTCKVFDAAVLPTFADAKQTTVWLHPDQSANDEDFRLLVRPLHPGEDSCSL